MPSRLKQALDGIAVLVSVAVLGGCGERARKGAESTLTPAAETRAGFALLPSEVVPLPGQSAAESIAFPYTDVINWKLYNALLMTGLTGSRTTVPLGAEQLEVRQVEKTDECAHVLTNIWAKGRVPTDDRHLRAYAVCPLSTAPSTYERGDKWLMKVQATDLNFNPVGKPTGWAAETFPSRSGAKNLVRFETTILVDASRTNSPRQAYTLWRDIGDRYVMADFLTRQAHPPEQE